MWFLYFVLTTEISSGSPFFCLVWFSWIRFGVVLLLVDSMRFNCYMRLSCITQTNISIPMETSNERTYERANGRTGERANVSFSMSSNSLLRFTSLLSFFKFYLPLFSSGVLALYHLFFTLALLCFAFVVVVVIVTVGAVVAATAINHVSDGKCDLL